MKFLRTFLVLMLMSSVLLACGAEETPAATEAAVTNNEAPTAVPAIEATEAPAAEAPTEVTPTESMTSTSTTASVTIKGLSFNPTPLTIPVNTLVTWTNEDSTSHTTTSDTDVWDSGTLNQGQSFSHLFDTPGTYNYFCEIHPSMQGTVIVEESTSEAAVPSGTLVVYSGRSESLVQPLIDMFTADTGIEVEVRYGDTAEMAAQILEEGDNSPADVYYGQDAGALGALSERFVPLNQELLDLVDPRFRAEDGSWIGTSGRARVLVYNPTRVTADELPKSVADLSDPAWSGRIGWAPTNGSFQAFVTALRITQGDAAARTWLEGMLANNVQAYEKNSAIVQAVAAGEVDAGLVNHYYLHAARKDNAELTAENYYFPNNDIGTLINVAGTGILATGQNQEAAQTFVAYLLSEKAQQYFATETFEYPLIEGVAINEQITPLSEISTPEIDLSSLEDLEGTLVLLQESGVIQ